MTTKLDSDEEISSEDFSADNVLVVEGTETETISLILQLSTVTVVTLSR